MLLNLLHHHDSIEIPLKAPPQFQLNTQAKPLTTRQRSLVLSCKTKLLPKSLIFLIDESIGIDINWNVNATWMTYWGNAMIKIDEWEGWWCNSEWLWCEWGENQWLKISLNSGVRKGSLKGEMGVRTPTFLKYVPWDFHKNVIELIGRG